MWLPRCPCRPRSGRPGRRTWCPRSSGSLLPRGQPTLVFGAADPQAAVGQRDAPRRPALRPPFVERPTADVEIGAHLGDGELVPLAAAANVVNAGHDRACQPPRRTGRPAQTAELTGTADCPW